MIIFWTHYANIGLSGDIYNVGKGEGEKKRMSSSKLDGLDYSSVEHSTGKSEVLCWGHIVSAENLSI